MGTMISLSLNGIDIDYGKNRYWTNHHWLFPPNSITNAVYRYADEVTEVKPAFQVALDEARFRLCHLGYSLHETKTKFERSVARWNRTAELNLTFNEFRDTLTGLDFASLTPAGMEAYGYDFRDLVIERLAGWDADGALLEDFIKEHLDFTLLLRCLAECSDNRQMILRWHHQDLVDSGWATVEDLTEVDREVSIINHTMLIGRLQDYSGAYFVEDFDRWLEAKGVARNTPYSKLEKSGAAKAVTMTLPGAVRNMIHHPENPHNALSDDDLRDSIECLLRVVRHLPTGLPGIT
ncbi:HEPN/Toprim-associated domain-containing protein [Leucobacter ruminantium]|uniref:HEPN/Toprim N-terminal domain-containing protein n=1 Tax=Leucobacter ruminantium TaxID=1289170 RepID=A0A939LX46_9MICO|nr:HEPN/Toprim-associated domain-containing protein [Leucobacter ruminantium]MBO1806051.1 hypothetical protein [Leucobacter ruminantium]